MKRLFVGVIAALATLVAAGTAFAAIDTYSAGYSFHGRSGSSHKPAALSFNQHFKLTATQSGSLTGILTDVKTTISNVKVNAAGFPTCTVSKINDAKNDTGCPKGALIASGSIQAELGTAQNYKPQGLNCDPLLDVWNAGKGQLAFFFKTNTTNHECLSGNITTGETPAFPASYHQSGSKIVVNIPIPGAVTNPGSGSYFAAVSSETLNWNGNKKAKGHNDIASTGCHGKRHFTYSFSARTPSGQHESKTVTGTAACG